MTDNRPTIVVCDDDSSRVKRWSERIELIPEVKSKYKVAPLEPRVFANAYKALKHRQLNFRSSSFLSSDDDAKVLDDAQVVVIDYDLTPTSGSGDLDERTLDTLSGSFGDNFAYLTRCFSQAGYTVLVNQDFFKSTFDLSHERFVNSNADLNVAHDDLGREELWTGRSSGTRFRPWSWPRLVDAPERRATLEVELDLDALVLESLGLSNEDTFGQFAPEQLVLFGDDPKSSRFRDAADFTRKFNRLGGPQPVPDAHLAKIAVASVSHWLERIVLPAQNVLIDAPHLAQRRPGLVTTPDPGQWAPLTDLSDPDGARGMLADKLVEPAEIRQLDRWMSRPVWLLHRCPRARIRAAGEAYAFCEDVSAFHPIDDASEYTSSVPGPFNQRFVLHDGVDTSEGFPPDYWPVQSLFAHAEAQ